VVEQILHVIQPILDQPGEVHPYFRGTWGPGEADRLLPGTDRWHPVS